MGVYLNAGNEQFREAIRSKIYVDKTGLIAWTNRWLETRDKCLCQQAAPIWKDHGRGDATGILQ